MKSRDLILSTLVVASFAFAGSASAQGRPIRPPAERGRYIVVYNQTNYRGNPRRYTGAVSNLGSRKVRSVTIGKGSWEICTDRNFRGDCVTLDQSVPDLSTEGFAGYVKSLRPARPPR
jgi:Beta/Gamma crystallin